MCTVSSGIRVAVKTWFWLSGIVSVLDDKYGQMEVACIWSSAASLSRTVVSAASELKASLESLLLKNKLTNSNVSWLGFSCHFLLPKAKRTHVLITWLYLCQARLRIVLDGWSRFCCLQICLTQTFFFCQRRSVFGEGRLQS